MIYYSYELDELVKQLKFVPYKLKKNATHEVGKTYYNYYWKMYYKVLEINGCNVKVEWQCGSISEHCTKLDILRDYELRPFEINIHKVYRESCTAAEIKALCCAGKLLKFVILDLNHYFFDNDKYKPNDYVYYFIIFSSGRTRLRRDLDKSPRCKL